MKKLYTLMTIALGAAMASPMANATINSVDELVRTYNAVYAWGFTDNNGNPDGEPNFLINPTISLGTEANEILLEGLFPTNGQDFPQDANLPIKGIVDLDTQTITFAANQVLGVDSYGTNTFYVAQYNLNNGNWDDASSATAEILSNGDISFPTEYIIGCQSTAGGGWYIYFTLILQPYAGEYVHDAAYYAGNWNTKFTWYRENANGTILNPPTTTNPTPTILADDDDKYEVEIVNLYPFYSSIIDIKGEVTPAGSIKINNLQNWENRSGAYQLIVFDENFLMPDYVLASPDEDGNLLFPANYTIGMGYYDTIQYNFQELTGYIDLQFLKDEAGVEGIEMDNNAPVKYFDLNGRSVNNPAPGQLLIKKQGNKASKVLVK